MSPVSPFEAICLGGVFLAVVLAVTAIGYIIWTEDTRP